MHPEAMQVVDSGHSTQTTGKPEIAYPLPNALIIFETEWQTSDFCQATAVFLKQYERGGVYIEKKLDVGPSCRYRL